MFQKDLKIFNVLIPKQVLIGIMGVILAYVAVSGIFSISSPWWLGKGDAPRHIDYVYRVYKGDIPKFNDSFQTPYIKDLAKGIYKDQPAATNPPLFYLIHAPFVGPSLSQGNWKRAIAIGRFINIFIGVLCVLALAWSGWLMGGARKSLLAVAVPALGVMMYHFTILNVNYAVDVLLVLFTTLTLNIIYKIIYQGVSTRYISLLVLLSVLGMATKVSYLVFVAISLIFILTIPFVNNRISSLVKYKKELIKAISICVIILLAILLFIGWFYYFRNYKTTGRFFSAAPVDYMTSRADKSLLQVLTSNGLWAHVYNNFTSITTTSVMLISFACAGVIALIDRKNIRKVIKNKKLSLVIALMIMAYVGTFFTQVSHSVGTGGFYFRYLLPAMVPMALFLSYGLLEFRWPRGQLVTLFIAIMGATTIYKIGRFDIPDYVIPSGSQVMKSLKELTLMVSNNGVPKILLYILTVQFIIGLLLIANSLFKLSNKNIQSTF